MSSDEKLNGPPEPERSSDGAGKGGSQAHNAGPRRAWVAAGARLLAAGTAFAVAVATVVNAASLARSAGFDLAFGLFMPKLGPVLLLFVPLFGDASKSAWDNGAVLLIWLVSILFALFFAIFAYLVYRGYWVPLATLLFVYAVDTMVLALWPGWADLDLESMLPPHGVVLFLMALSLLVRGLTGALQRSRNAQQAHPADGQER